MHLPQLESNAWAVLQMMGQAADTDSANNAAVLGAVQETHYTALTNSTIHRIRNTIVHVTALNKTAQVFGKGFLNKEAELKIFSLLVKS